MKTRKIIGVTLILIGVVIVSLFQLFLQTYLVEYIILITFSGVLLVAFGAFLLNSSKLSIMDVEHINIQKINLSKIGFMKKYFFIKSIAIISLFIGFLSGFYYRNVTMDILNKAMGYDSKWKRDDYITLVDANSSFFSLERHNYNWLAFFLTTVAMFILLLVVRITITKEQLNMWLIRIENPKNDMKATKN